MAALAELGTMKRLLPVPDALTPEAAWLGLDPRKVRLAQGPLTVAALGFEPPDRSVQFHLSLMSFDGDCPRICPFEIPEDDLRAVFDAARRLDTKALTLIEGEDRDHALVWERGSIDLRTRTPQEADGKPMPSVLPEGDGEPVLRRFIDDSVNLLSEQEFNMRRLEEGLPPLNLLWPWGQGFRTEVPNLALIRGEPANVESASMRMAGLTRMARYRHGDRKAFGKGTNIQLERLAKAALGGGLTIVVLDQIGDFRSQGKLEEAEWLSREIDRRLLGPLLDASLREPTRIFIAAPSCDGTGSDEPSGLSLRVETGTRPANSVPFDERALEERAVPVGEVWKEIEEVSLWEPNPASL